MRESLVLLLRGTAPDVYCLKCLAEAFPDVVDLGETVRALIAEGAPVEARPGQCCICHMSGTVVGHPQASR
jgi:hypothetical protein